MSELCLLIVEEERKWIRARVGIWVGIVFCFIYNKNADANGQWAMAMVMVVVFRGGWMVAKEKMRGDGRWEM